MGSRTISPMPITPQRFAPFGDVVHSSAVATAAMNDARFERFDDLAKIDIDCANDGRVALGIVRCRTATTLPYRFDLMERHPLGSQAFIPRGNFSFIVVVAPAGESVEEGDIRAFVTSGSEGINYHRGVWHMPLIALQGGQEFLVLDRFGGSGNLQEIVLREPLTLEAS